MPSYQHEVPLHMIRERPHLAVEILREACGIDVPAHDEVVLASENVSTLHPAELNCDGAIVANEAGQKVFGVVVESQLRKDDDKDYSWPAYVSTFRHQHRCDVALLVLCTDRANADRLAAPITLGPPGSVVYPITVSPEALPPITDPDEAARRPELTVLTAPAHADGPYAEDVVRAYCKAIDVLPPETRKLYHDYGTSLFSDAARKLLEKIVKTDEYQWQSDFAIEHRSEGRAEGHAEGLAEGEATALLAVLQGRNIRVSAEARERITTCTETDRLIHWVNRALTINKIDELFD